MEENSLFRNVFNRDLICAMSKNILFCYPKFDQKTFEKNASNKLNELSFKERNIQITNALITSLPTDFKISGLLLLNVINSNHVKYNGNWDSFYYMPFGSYVSKMGCQKEYLPISFKILQEITVRFTSEFAIRPFINLFPKESINQLNEWKKHKNENVRRLASEGSRPRLPWAEKINAHINNPEPCFNILKDLMADESLYVKKSVANHLNDISKDNPEQLFKFLEPFSKSTNPNTQWIIKQALRTLVKKGNPIALKLLGFSEPNEITLKNFMIFSKLIKMGEQIDFSFVIENQSNSMKKLVVDYVVYHQKSNGQLLPKVFKLKNIVLHEKETVLLKKKHSFKLINTRKYYPGLHQIAVQVNGLEFDKINFELLEE